MDIQNRIVGVGDEPLDAIMFNPNNWRIHPKEQQVALLSVLERVGWIQRVIINKRTGNLVDGHLRCLLAERHGDRTVPAIYIDVSQEEEDIILMSLDPIAAMANTDKEKLQELMTQIENDDVGINALMADIAKTEKISLGELLTADARGKLLSERFIVPPFSVLDARQGYWQERKRLWLSQGIESEVGRGETIDGEQIDETTNTGRLTFVKGNHAALDPVSQKIMSTGTNTSVFDPVLCELIYRWFAPHNGVVLDPFAGGSVRGVIAGLLGYKYIGVDLSARQVTADIAQGHKIFRNNDIEFIDVKVSEKMARLLFHGCDEDYVENVCHSSCCDSTTSESGTLITIHPAEQEKIEKHGGVVVGGMLQPINRKCPFKDGRSLCMLHNTDAKPFGCIASPFTLNDNSTLIVRNRYRLLKCYGDGGKPAYVVFRTSLDLIFGKIEAERICVHLDSGGGDIIAKMPLSSYKMLIDNDNIKHGVINVDRATTQPTWLVGDSKDIDVLAPGEYDLVFSCPPYADLETYSDDPRDISNMKYADFLLVYREIIKKSVAMLKENRFACFVVGDIRDEKGFYRNFVSDTIQAFLDAGMMLYNEAILIMSIGSLAIRTGKSFSDYRKLGKGHQNVLVFYKGDTKKIKEFGAIEVNNLEE